MSAQSIECDSLFVHMLEVGKTSGNLNEVIGHWDTFNERFLEIVRQIVALSRNCAGTVHRCECLPDCHRRADVSG